MAVPRLVKKLSISVVSPVVFLLLAEAVAWLLGCRPLSDERLLNVGHEDVHFGYEPDQETTHSHHGRETTVHINQHGHRGPDFPKRKPPGEYRIFGIGDSMAFGPGVNDGDTFYAKLETLYAEEGRDVLVVNAGVSGYSSYHYRAWAEGRIAGYDPDTFVVALYTGNDNEITTTAKTVIPTTPIWQKLRHYSALVVCLDEFYRNWLWKRIEALDKDKSFEEVEKELEQYRGKTPQNLDKEGLKLTWERAFEHMNAIAELTEERGIRFVVLLLPTCDATEEQDPAKVFRWVKTNLEEKGIDVIDPLDELRAEHPHCWLPYDPGHFDRPGHAVLARVLHDELAKRGIPPE